PSLLLYLPPRVLRLTEIPYIGIILQANPRVSFHSCQDKPEFYREEQGWHVLWEDHSPLDPSFSVGGVYAHTRLPVSVCAHACAMVKDRRTLDPLDLQLQAIDLQIHRSQTTHSDNMQHPAEAPDKQRCFLPGPALVNSRPSLSTRNRQDEAS
ncbi:hypothetical protein STEG23_006908, partial [Scotinomys teguina]